MNKLKFYTSLYSKLRNYGLPYWFLAPIRRGVRNVANRQLSEYFMSTPIRKYDHNRIQKNLIVSFTSFPARIDYVWMVVETMKRQTVLPEKIILWLSIDQFPNKALPKNLLDEIDELFVVRFVEGDIRSHKKYYYSSLEFPDSYIFLVDDDILYAPDLLENVWNAHLAHPDCVISNYGFIMQYDCNGNILSDSLWVENYSERIDKNFFFGSGGGTLIIPSMLYRDLVNVTIARELTPIADDIWLNAMVRLSRTPIFMIKHGVYLRANIKENEKLSTLNVGENHNDIQIQKLISYYKEKLGINPFERL